MIYSFNPVTHHSSYGDQHNFEQVLSISFSSKILSFSSKQTSFSSKMTSFSSKTTLSIKLQPIEILGVGEIGWYELTHHNAHTHPTKYECPGPNSHKVSFQLVNRMSSIFKEGGLRQAHKLQIDILGEENWHHLVSGASQMKNSILRWIYSLSSVRFQGVLNCFSSFSDSHIVKSEIWPTFGKFKIWKVWGCEPSGYQKWSNHKNSPDLSVSERDLNSKNLITKYWKTKKLEYFIWPGGSPPHRACLRLPSLNVTLCIPTQ